MSNKPSNYRWTVCGLLFFATTVNYLDRQVLSLLAPQLTESFHWTNADYANITTIFQLVYALSMLAAGRFIDRVGTKRGYLIAISVWSIGAMMHAFSEEMGAAALPLLGLVGLYAVPASVLGFMISRAVLGLGEAGNFPAAIKVTAEHFEPKERAFATGIFNSGANIGAILAPLTVPWMAEFWGWQTAFILVGAVGFIWIFFWQIMYKPAVQSTAESTAVESISESDQQVADANTPSTGVLKSTAAWAFIAGKFFTDGVWWFFLFWLPKYLDAQYQMKGTEIITPLIVLYSLTMVGSIGGGWLPSLFIKKGYTTLRARTVSMGGIAILPLLVLLAQPLGGISYWVPVLCIGFGAAAHQAWSANLYTLVSDLFPKNKIARIVGIGGMAGGLGSILLTQIAGKVFDYYDAQNNISLGYTYIFIYCAIAYIGAWFCIRMLLRQQLKNAIN
ncbi:MAG: MFS transporter [Flavobacterium sp. BFFFF2]|nr:MAG: MFS transporter [Flavobacterium sp. BFFFF2]